MQLAFSAVLKKNTLRKIEIEIEIIKLITLIDHKYTLRILNTSNFLKYESFRNLNMILAAFIIFGLSSSSLTRFEEPFTQNKIFS